MRKEFLVERQGRTFCLYAGLLDLATQQCLKSIHTELIQAPTDANNRVAICAATVVLEKDGELRTFTGLGDAAPNNVTPAMQTCLLRMAETRAKARAMRDAVNIGMAALEELGDDDEQRPAQARQTAPRDVRRPATQAATAQSASSPAAARSAGTRTINTSGALCPECHAPAGAAHTSKCSQARAA